MLHKGSTCELRRCTFLESIWYSPKLVTRHNARDRICSGACRGLSCFPRTYRPVHSPGALEAHGLWWLRSAERHCHCKQITFRCRGRAKASKRKTKVWNVAREVPRGLTSRKASRWIQQREFHITHHRPAQSPSFSFLPAQSHLLLSLSNCSRSLFISFCFLGWHKKQIKSHLCY